MIPDPAHSRDSWSSSRAPKHREKHRKNTGKNTGNGSCSSRISAPIPAGNGGGEGENSLNSLLDQSRNSWLHPQLIFAEQGRRKLGFLEDFLGVFLGIFWEFFWGISGNSQVSQAPAVGNEDPRGKTAAGSALIIK